MHYDGSCYPRWLLLFSPSLLTHSSDPSFPHQLPHIWSSRNRVGWINYHCCLSNTPTKGHRMMISSYLSQELCCFQKHYYWSKWEQAIYLGTFNDAPLQICRAVINLFWIFFHQLEQEEIVSLGGPGKSVEIGVISLGTTSADGSKREVRKISSNSSVFTDGSHSKLMFICLIFDPGGVK